MTLEATDYPLIAATSAGSSDRFVLATTEEGTVLALRKAMAEANETGSAVRLLVPVVTPVGESPRATEQRVAALRTQYAAVLGRTGLAAELSLCVCIEPRHVPARLLLTNARILVGGRRRAWWPTREERLARRLASEGHLVAFCELQSAPASVIESRTPMRA